MSHNYQLAVVLVPIAVVGLLASTPVAEAVFLFSGINLSFLTSFYAGAGSAIASAISFATVNFPTVTLAWPLDFNTTLGLFQAVVSTGVLLIGIREKW